MLDTMTSQKIKPFLIIFFGSSSTDSDGADFFNLPYPSLRCIPFKGMSAVPDTVSHAGRSTMIFKNETFRYQETRYQETISEEMLEHDVIVKMPSKKSFSIRARITRIKKATPKIVVSENTSLED